MTKSRKPAATRWTVARAKERFSELLRAARSGPQPIFRRDELVAILVDAESFDRLADVERQAAARSLGEAFEELRGLVSGEDYDWPAIERVTRPDAFGEALDDPAR